MTQRVFVEVLNQGRLQLFDEIYSPDFVKHVDGRTRTLAQERLDTQSTRAALSDLVVTVDALIAERDKVAVLYTGRGTNTGPISGLPPKGHHLEISGMTVYRFAGGKIVEEWTVYNELEILRQMGHYP